MRSVYFISIYVFLSSLLFFVVARPSTPIREINVLKILYDSNGGENWNWNYDTRNYGLIWNFTDGSDPCYDRWQGLYCTNWNVPTGPNIFSLQLNSYGLYGTLPAQLDHLTSMLILSFGDNSLSGPLPNISSLSYISYLNLSHNSFVGTIPPTYGNFKFLVLFYASYNQLIGSIPDQICNLLSLQYLYLLKNKLTGTIPNKISSLSNLTFLSLGQNQLYGTIPPSINDLSLLEHLYLNENKLFGPIPDLSRTKLSEFSVENNFLSGCIPLSLGSMGRLRILKLDSNNFGCKIPSFKNLTKIEILQLQNNHFSGYITDILDPLNNTYLKQLDISENSISGTIPSIIFQLPKVQTISLAKNCFHGTLPGAICDASDIQVLSLDGLTTSSKCLNYLWDPAHLTVGYLSYKMRGGIPECIWKLKNLSTLHLSGNGFTGSLEALSKNIQLNETKLNDLSLSHNIFTGTIPHELKMINLSNFDLSYNKFYGAIDDMGKLDFAYSPDSKGISVNLEVNRLSGIIPRYFQEAYGIQILSGNVFFCSTDHPAPAHDPSYDNYNCGSDEFNRSLMVFGATSGIVFLLLFSIYVVRYKINIEKLKNKIVHFFDCIKFTYSFVSIIGIRLDGFSYKDTSNINNETFLNSYSNFFRYVSSISLIRYLAIVIMLFTNLVCSPIYVLFYLVDSDSYSTHVNRYTWITSSVYLTGDPPAITLLLVWTILIILVLLLVIESYKMYKRKKINFRIISLDFVRNPFFINELKEESPHQLNSRDDIDFDPEYDDASEDPEAFQSSPSGPQTPQKDRKPSSLTKEGQPISLSTANNPIVSPNKGLIESHSAHTSSDLTDFTKSERDINCTDKYFQLLKFFLVFAFNCCVSLTYNCVYVLLLSSSNISSSEKVLIQLFFAGVKLFWNIIVVRALIDLLPFNRYSVKLHIIMLIFNSLVAPCLATAFSNDSCFKSLFYGSDSISTTYSYLACLESEQTFNFNNILVTICTNNINSIYETNFTPTFIYYYTCGSTLVISYIPVYIYSYAILIILSPIYKYFLCRVNLNPFPEFVSKSIDGIFRPNDTSEGMHNYLMKPHSIQALLLHHIVIMLTFGVASPPLSFVCCVAMVIDTYVWQMVLIRYIKYGSSDNPFYHKLDNEVFSKDSIERMTIYSTDFSVMNELKLSMVEVEQEQIKIERISKVCRSSWKSIRNSIWIIFLCYMTFFMFMLFDMSGDKGGFIHALWVLVTVPILTLIIRAFIVRIVSSIMRKLGLEDLRLFLRF